jgi:hypothetical protein
MLQVGATGINQPLEENKGKEEHTIKSRPHPEFH